MKYFLFYPIVYIFTAVLTKDFNMSEAKCLKFKKIFCWYLHSDNMLFIMFISKCITNFRKLEYVSQKYNRKQIKPFKEGISVNLSNKVKGYC